MGGGGVGSFSVLDLAIYALLDSSQILSLRHLNAV